MNDIVMKNRLFGDEISALNLLEFKRELTLLKRLIKITECYVEKKAIHETDTFDGVCYYIARSIVQYSKAAFDTLVLGHFDACEMVNRTIVENKVILELICFDETSELWKYYLVHAHWMAKKAREIDPRNDAFIANECARLSIRSDFISNRENKKPYIEMQYGWAYQQLGNKKFDFENLCAIKHRPDYEDFRQMSQYSHNTSFYRKVVHHSGVERVMGIISSIYIGLYELVTSYCDEWDDDFDRVVDELEAIIHHFLEVYAYEDSCD